MDNLVLNPDELSSLTKRVADVLYDMYFTSIYVKNTEVSNEVKISQDHIDSIYQKTLDSLKSITSTTDKDKIMETYNKILKDNPGLLITENNVLEVIDNVINRLDFVPDISEEIVYFNDFDDSGSEEDKLELKVGIENMTEEFKSLKTKGEFIDVFNKYYPIVCKYILVELEMSDLLKPLGSVTSEDGNMKYGSPVYYINIEHGPKAPIGYSDVFTYPLAPYKLSTFLDIASEDFITQEVRNNKLTVEVKNIDFLAENGLVDMVIKHETLLEDISSNETCIQLNLRDYLVIYMSKDMSELVRIILSILEGNENLKGGNTDESK